MGGCRKLHNKDPINLYCSTNANHIKEDDMDWACSTHPREISPALPTQALFPLMLPSV
jgi:hypothetical protein